MKSRLIRAVSTGPAKNRSRCILSVDDEAAILFTRHQILKKAGYDVISAADGEQALHFYDVYATSIDVVLLDYAMPGLDGGVVARQIKRYRRKVPIIMVTANIVPEQTLRFADCVIDKGEGPLLLLEKIAQFLDRFPIDRTVPVTVLDSRERKHKEMPEKTGT